MVRTWLLGRLRMRKQSTKTTVPLDAVPERHTERFPPRFRPVGRFCELRFRYLSSPTGREGEISQPLDHMWHTPFIHSTRYVSTTISIHITERSSYFLHVVHRSVYGIFDNCTCPNSKMLISKIRAVIQVVLCSTRFRAGAYWQQNRRNLRMHVVYYLVPSCCTLVISINFIYLFTYYFQFPDSNYWYMNPPFAIKQTKEKRNKNLERTMTNRARVPKPWQTSPTKWPRTLEIDELSSIYRPQTHLIRLFLAKKKGLKKRDAIALYNSYASLVPSNLSHVSITVGRTITMNQLLTTYDNLLL